MWSKLQEYARYLGLDAASTEAKYCLLGVILVKFGTGAIGIWGIINIYFFSFYKKDYFLFEEDVADGVPSMTFWMGFIQTFFCIPGAFLISLNLTTTQSVPNNQSSSEVQDHIVSNDKSYLITGKSHQSPNGAAADQNDENSIEMKLLNPSSVETQQQHEPESQPLSMSLLQAAQTTPFKIIYISTFIISCFSLFISINFKIYGLTKINDDHFLTFLVTFCSISSSLSNLFWGYLVDRHNFKNILQIIIVTILAAGFLFPYLSDTKIGFFITFQTLSACERGLYTIIGPGLVQIFGLGLGAQLFPIKSTSFFLALIFLPLIQFVLLSYFDFDQTTHILLIGVALSLWMSSKLQLSYNYLKV